MQTDPTTSAAIAVAGTFAVADKVFGGAEMNADMAKRAGVAGASYYVACQTEDYVTGIIGEGTLPDALVEPALTGGIYAWGSEWAGVDYRGKFNKFLYAAGSALAGKNLLQSYGTKKSFRKRLASSNSNTGNVPTGAAGVSQTYTTIPAGKRLCDM